MKFDINYKDKTINEQSTISDFHSIAPNSASFSKFIAVETSEKFQGINKSMICSISLIYQQFCSQMSAL